MMCVLTILLTTYSHDQSCICHQPLYDQHLRNGWQPQLCPSIPIAQESHVFSMPTGSSELRASTRLGVPTAHCTHGDIGSSRNLCSSILTFKKYHRFLKGEGPSCILAKVNGRPGEEKNFYRLFSIEKYSSLPRDTFKTYV